MNPASRATVLVVDDQATNLAILSDWLTEAGYRVLIARDGESAVFRAQHAHPDLVLMDVRMPGMDGLEACRRICDDPGTGLVPVVMMTALADVEDRTAMFQAGAWDCVAKPMEQGELLARVGNHLVRHWGLRALRDQAETLRTLWEQSPAPQLVVDGGLVAQRANPAALRLLEGPLERSVGELVRCPAAPCLSQAACASCPLPPLVAGVLLESPEQAPAAVEVPGRLANGRPGPVRLTGKRVDLHGHPGVLLVLWPG